MLKTRRFLSGFVIGIFLPITILGFIFSAMLKAFRVGTNLFFDMLDEY